MRVLCFGRGVVAVVGVVWLSLLPGVALNPGKSGVGDSYWKGISGGYRWVWTDRDIAATTLEGRGVFSVRDTLLPKKRKPESKDKDDDSGYAYFEANCNLLSVVGGIASYQMNSYWEGGAHPSGWESYFAVDAAHPEHNLKLTALFPDAVLLRAFLADPIVQRVRRENHISITPKTCGEFVRQMQGKCFDVSEGLNYSFPEDLLERFAFHHIENGKVSIRLCLPHGYEISRFHHTELGLLLPIPPKLRDALRRAAHRQNGFLMENRTAAEQKAVTKIVVYEHGKRVGD